jgi:exopolysaccharide biosynthesis protein
MQEASCKKQKAKSRLQLAPCLLLILVSLACADAIPTSVPASPASPAARPVSTATAHPLPSPTPEPDDTGWQNVGNGIESRRLKVDVGGASSRLWIARLDPARVHLRVLYDPDNPRLVSEWFESSHPLLVVNAGYFTPDHHATGLIIAEGKRSGQSYTGFGGMLAVRSDRVEVRWLVAKPYSASEPLQQAVQAFPMLVHSGKPTLDEDDGKVSRRTAVGQDRRGRIVFVSSTDLVFTLKSLSTFLAASDLELDSALNLDGGTSAGLLLAGRDGPIGVDSWVQVPAVIVAAAR